MQTQLVAPTPRNGSVLIKKSNPVYTVYETTNYDLFKVMGDNRDVNSLHVKRLIESFQAQHLVCPIIVNEKHEVIDGQHRLEASKQTGLPVYFLVVPGYGIEQVQVLNTNQKNWTKMDYLKMYVADGRKAYLELQQFMVDFPDFGIQSAERLVTLKSTGKRQGKVMGQRAQMKDFEEGRLNIPNIHKSYQLARRIYEFKPYYTNFHRGTFISALLPLFSNKAYDHKEMIYKVAVCFEKNIRLVDCHDVAAYRMLLEDIYNWKRQKENKVSFRYA